jgi:hypothetical protein
MIKHLHRHGRGVYWACNRNECQETVMEVKRGRWARLRTWPPTMNRLSRQCGILEMPQQYRPRRPITGIPFLSFCIVFIVCNVLYCLCSLVGCVLFERGVLFCEVCVFACCLLIVPLLPGKKPFAVQIILTPWPLVRKRTIPTINNNNNNNNNNKCYFMELSTARETSSCVATL